MKFFVEKDVSAIKILKENLNKLSILEKQNCLIMMLDIF